MTSDLAHKLKQKVCRYAQTAHDSLPAEAEKWLNQRVSNWVASRTVSDSALRAAAHEFKLMFASLPQRRAGSAVKSKSEGTNYSQQHPTRSVTTEPAHPISSFQQQPQHVAAAPSRAQGVGSSLSGASAGVSVRPQVLRRLQRLNDDAPFIKAVEQEQHHLEHEKELLLKEKQRKQAAVRLDMQQAEELRQRRIQEEKAERDKLHRQMMAIVEENRMAEQDEKILRRRKIEQEKQLIEEQTRSKQEFQESLKKREQDEIVRLKAYVAVQDRNALLHEIERQAVSKAAMTEALAEGKLSAEQRTAQRKAARENPQPQVFDTRVGGVAVEAAKERAKKREILQSFACEHYAELQLAKRVELERLDHSVAEARMRQLQQAEERERKDKERSIQLRSVLVSSLDEELSHQRERKAKEEEEKRRQRELADEVVEATRRQQHELRCEKLRQQALRRQQMDAQLASRMEKVVSPICIKI